MTLPVLPRDPAQALAPLREFVADTTRLAGQTMPESERVARVRALLAGLIAEDGWLPEAAAKPHPQYYQQYLLHCDPLQRFSVVSFVWGPGQKTPIHDHTVWGIIGMLRGSECAQRYTRGGDGRLTQDGAEATLQPGDLDIVSPTRGDIHLVRNALAVAVSTSIHLYGGNIGRISRHVFVPGTETVKDFVSGYSNALSPNLWARRLP